MGEAQHFERGQNWRAKNINSIKLDIKGKKHPVEVRRVEAMSDEQAAAATARRQATKRVLETEQADRKRREVRRIAAMKADVDHAEEGHTPEGWVPASRRGFVDPFSMNRQATPKKRAPKKSKKAANKKRRSNGR